MSEYSLVALIVLVVLGFATIVLTPRERRKKQTVAGDTLEGLDPYAAVVTLLNTHKRKKALRIIKKFVSEENDSVKKRLLTQLLEEVRKLG